MGPLLRLAQIVPSAPGNHIHPMLHEIVDHVFKVQAHRPAIYQGQVVNAKTGLQNGAGKQLIQNHFRNGIFL